MIVVVIDEAGSRLHRHSSPQLSMQAYEIADDDDRIMDLLTTGQMVQKPALLETAEGGNHISVCSSYTFLRCAVCLSVCRLSHLCTLLKPFDRFICHLASTLVGSKGTLCQMGSLTPGKGKSGKFNPHPKHAVSSDFLQRR